MDRRLNVYQGPLLQSIQGAESPEYVAWRAARCDWDGWTRPRPTPAGRRGDPLLVLAEIRAAQGQTRQARAQLQDALGPVWEAQELKMTLHPLLLWATLGGGEVVGDASLSRELLRTVADHPSSRSVDRALALARLADLSPDGHPDSSAPGESTGLGALVRQPLVG